LKTDLKIGFFILMKAELKEWYKSWFDTKYYHVLYNNRSDKEAELFIKDITKKLAIKEHAAIWDLACGKGRHAIALNKLNFNVCGTDLSRESIQLARIHENEHLSFFELDMRSPFRINYFDVVTNLFTSFGYFEKNSDDLKVLQSVSNSLKKNGLFIFDYLNPNSIKIDEEKTILKDDITFIIKKELVENKIIKHIEVKDGLETLYFNESVKLFQPEEIMQLAKQVHLEEIMLFGDYELNSFNTETSPRMIFVFQKR
jgi:SAM-dependent methyltransferase